VFPRELSPLAWGQGEAEAIVGTPTSTQFQKHRTLTNLGISLVRAAFFRAYP